MGCCVSSARHGSQPPHSSAKPQPQSTARKPSVTDSTRNSTTMSNSREHEASASSGKAPTPSPEADTHPNPSTQNSKILSAENSVNSQPPLVHLYDHGFITPLSMQFIRNHGSAPRLQWQQHKLYVKGLVEAAKFFTMDQLASMPSVTMPVSVTSGSNRAKEMNMVKVTSGLNWGAGATSCSFWTGVRLSEILRSCQVDVLRAKYVHFKASEQEKLPNGVYSASIDIETASSPFSNVLVAYKQNGEHLSVERGFPIRVIVPGWIGARMVKWLSTIEVSDTPLDAFYSRYENRIFPSFVDRQIADAERYWFQEQHAFNELNINSVIVHPCHQHLFKPSEETQFEIKGYAYSGSGRKITRVELSLNGGHSWKPCSLTFPEEKFVRTTNYGKYYCWMFWTYQVEASDLLKALRRAGELRCRAWDQSNNTQPGEMNWNMLGCGNNCHYVVKADFMTGSETHPEARKAANDDVCIRFVHPTVAGGNQGGWMEIRSFAAPLVSEVVGRNGGGNMKSGSKALISHSAANANNNMGMHSLKGFSIPGGRVDQPMPKCRVSFGSETSLSSVLGVANAPVKALDPSAWLSFELVEKKMISFDTRVFKFKLPSNNHYLGVPVGQHILARIVVDGEPLIRAYTPISSEKQLGYFTLCVKIYFAGSDLLHPRGGKMSQFMECLLLGDKISITGPCGEVHYKGNGVVSFQKREKQYAKIGLICGGTGITPAFQVMHDVYQHRSDRTEIFLLYANRTQHDILLKADLDLMAKKRENIHVWYTLEKTTSSWTYSGGLVTEQMIRSRIPEAGDDTLVLLCGPPEMLSTCLSSVRNIGHSEENIMKF